MTTLDSQVPSVKAGAIISPIGHTALTGRLHRKWGVMTGFRHSYANFLPVPFTLEKGLQILYSRLWNKHGTSKSGLPFHIPAKNTEHSPVQSFQTYEPRGGKIWSHPQGWAERYTGDQEQRGNNIGLMPTFSSKGDLRTTSINCS